MSEGSARSGGREDGVDVASLDAVVAALRASALPWASTSAAQRAALVTRALADTRAVAPAWNTAACRAKGLDPTGNDAGEELLAGIGMLVRALSDYRRALRDISRTGRPQFPGRVRRRDGRLVVRVLPSSLLDRVIYTGDRAEVWMEPGVDRAALRATQAAAYRRPREHVGVTLVLGAGNVAALGPKDAVHKMIVEGHVVVLKANDVNAYLVEYWRRALAAFIEAGALHIVTGDARVGDYLVHHPGVDDVHLTGAPATYDAVVFGPGAAGAQRRARGEVQLTKPVSAELSNVSPVIVVPGRWSRRQLDYQAQHVATMLVNNAGFNCLTPRVLVTHRDWPQRGEFLDALEAVLSRVPTRRAYYPGAFERRDAFVRAHPEARRVGAHTHTHMPWTMIRDVDASRHDDICFTTEAFCALLAETALEAPTPEDYVATAVEFCNEVLTGTLSMTLLVDPRTRRRRTMRVALERAVADLRYGCIGVNVWHALGILIGSVPWGAYPGHEPRDIQSGVGTVGNALMFARPQKSVVRGPFVAWPTPAWFVTHRRSGRAIAEIFEVQCTLSWARVPAALWAAIRP